MEKMIAFCGLDCAQCEAYQATQAGDETAKKLVVEKWMKEFNIPHLETSQVECDGCTCSGQRLSSYCQVCQIHACALKRGVENCAWCADYADCSILNDFLKNVPVAKANLEQIRATF